MFEYTTRVNKRSKRIKLQFCVYRGLIISSPKKLNSKRLNSICLEHQDWIKTQLIKYPIKAIEQQPSQLNLIALEENFNVAFEINNKNKAYKHDDNLLIQGKTTKHQIINLKHWIRNKAKTSFSVKLKYWADKTQLNYSKLSVRSQKSRWGSCSSAGSISLNDQLLFMPSSVLDYIIVHELCHTVHPNHSARYWALVNMHYPQYKQQELILAEYSKKIPSWFRASLY